MAPSTRPPHQQHAATTPALRGPTRSSQPPQIAAETPSKTKNSVYIQPMLAMRQSQVVVNSSCTSVMSGHGIGCRDAERARQRQPEHAEAVGHADAQMNAERGRRHQPAIEPGLGDDAFAIEESHSRIDKFARTCDAVMFVSPFSGALPAPSLCVAVHTSLHILCFILLFF